jgi:hypothetical protein
MPRGEGTSPLEEYTHQILARPRCLPRELWQGGAPDPGKGGINGFNNRLNPVPGPNVGRGHGLTYRVPTAESLVLGVLWRAGHLST